MRLRTFTAPNMPAAMKMVREEMGDEAIIVASETVGAKRAINVTAVVDKPEEAAGPKPVLEVDNTAADDLRFELQNVLRFHNLPELFVAKLLHKATDTELSAALALHRLSGQRDRTHLHRLAIEKMITAYFTFEPLDITAPSPARIGKDHIMLVGAPGIGKTLTVGKIAARLAMDQQPLAVITTDNKRAGGIEQLQAFTDILDIDLKIATTRAELSAQLQKLPEDTRVLIDTAGCNPYDHSELKELKSFAQSEGIEPVLVMAAGGDSLEAIDAVEAFSVLPIRRLLVTRADTARRFGGVLAAAAAHKFAFCNISSSSSIIDTLAPADGAALAHLMLRYQSQP